MKQILVIDDERDILFLMQSILETRGYKVTTDDSGEVFEVLGELATPDLILLDINIGDKNGGAICAQLKADERTKHVPIILISGEKDVRQIKEQSGADDYLTKPFNFNQLISKVSQFLDVT